MLLDRFDNVQILANYNLKIICADTNIKNKFVVDLRRLLYDINQNLRVLQVLGQPTEDWDTILIHLICRRLDQDLRQEWFVLAEEVIANNSVKSKLSKLLSLLEIQCNPMESDKVEATMFKSKPGTALNPLKYTRTTAIIIAPVNPKSECFNYHNQYVDGLNRDYKASNGMF